MIDEGASREKRQYQRISVVLDIVCECVGRDAAWVDQSGDISLGGVRVFSDEESNPGDRLKLIVKIEDREIEAMAVVRWLRPAVELDAESVQKYAVGLAFVDLGPGYAGVLSKLIEDHSLHYRD
jgi:c-di-GMP-binding flagellar brake protein YcgR